jgi:hypothetical protein
MFYISKSSSLCDNLLNHKCHKTILEKENIPPLPNYLKNIVTKLLKILPSKHNSNNILKSYTLKTSQKKTLAQ